MYYLEVIGEVQMSTSPFSFGRFIVAFEVKSFHLKRYLIRY